VIPVTPQPPPPCFNQRVRTPGRRWLNNNQISLTGPPPRGKKLPDYWREVLPDLWEAYGGICAYLAIYFEWPIGAATTEHFIAKSSDAGQAYEWSNYRLTCLGPNRSKNRFDDILDPFTLRADTFWLNLADGRIYPNPTLSPTDRSRADNTIRRLRLNDPRTMAMRVKHYEDYLNQDWSERKFKGESPFVWYEANRQGLL
jgi:uncharacterized protein (TIGR02646 family)